MLTGTSTAKARIPNIAWTVPAALRALQDLHETAQNDGVPSRTIDLVHLRASQINGCSLCVEMHGRGLRNAGETDERINSVALWREAPCYTEAERAALGLAEAVTRLSDRNDPVPDEVWDEAARHYDESGLASLIISIAVINVWNRFNVATRQVAGGSWG